MMKTAWAMVALGVSAPASAATETFTVGGTVISFPLPAGYCRAEGAAAKVYDILAQADTLNLTLIDLLPCATRTVPGSDHIGVKTAKDAIGVKLPRATLLATLKPEFDKPELRDSIDQKTQTLSNNLGTATGQKIVMSGSFGPRGIDADCAYLAGTLATNVNGKAGAPQGTAGCLSSVADAFVSVNVYAADPSPDSVRTLMRRARAMMLSMTGRAAP